MSLELMLRLALVPAAVWLASLAARRFGHAASGYLGGMPLIGGPITLFLAMDQGAEFGARSALYTLAAVSCQAAHLLAFGHAGRVTKRWWLALPAGWLAFASMAAGVSQLHWSIAGAAIFALCALLLASRFLPRSRGFLAYPAIPRAEMYLRLVAAVALAAFIFWSAPRFGPVVSGILLSLPITGSIMPPFTLALYGPVALARLLRGFAVGLAGFSSFFAIVAATAPAHGIAMAFTGALVGALAAVFAARRLAHGGRNIVSPEELP